MKAEGRLKGWTRAALRVALGLACIGALVVLSTYGGCRLMKAKATAPQSAQLERRLGAHVRMLSETIGNRSISDHENLERAAAYIEAEFLAQGYAVAQQNYTVSGRTARNLIAERRGTRVPDEVVIIGAHYDSCYNPGADDNASGVAGLIELARAFASQPVDRTVRFVAFTNEEPPYFETGFMGSRVYAQSLKESGDKVRGAVILEMIGYYDSRPFSQRYPALLGFLYPNRGDFIAIVGNFRSSPLIRAVKGAFRRSTSFPIESMATFESVPGVNWSDHASFWREGYPAVMVTDTAYLRNPHYHAASDTWEKLDFMRTACVVEGLAGAVAELVSLER